MLISDFTVPELDHLRVNCNFVGNEKEVFELRSQGIPLEQVIKPCLNKVTNRVYQQPLLTKQKQ